MADDLIHCPACGFQLRLPTELYGTPVECPQCHARFTAPAPAARPAADRPPPGREYDAGARSVPDGNERNRPTSGAGLTAPALCLLVTSLLGILVNGYMAMVFVEAKNKPNEYNQAIEDAIKQQPNLQPPQQAQFREGANWFRDNGTAPFGVLLALNLVTALGAVQMLRRRTYGLALLGCIFALNPVNFGCCFVVQVPFGLWGLIALLTGDGRAAFR